MGRAFMWATDNSASLITYKILSQAAMGHYSEQQLSFENAKKTTFEQLPLPLLPYYLSEQQLELAAYQKIFEFYNRVLSYYTVNGKIILVPEKLPQKTFNRDQFLKEASNVIIQKDKTMADLAEIFDKYILFPDENSI